MNIFINEEEQRFKAGWRILFQFILMLLIFLSGAFGLSFIFPKSHFITSVVPLFIGVLISIWLAAKYFDNRSLTDYGINLNKLWAKEYMIGVGIAVLAQGTIFVIEWWAGWITITGFGWNANTEIPFVIGFISFFLAMLMVGFHEELFSRGYQILNLTEGLRYPQIGTRGAIIIAVFLTSSLFGFLHASNPNASAISTFNIILAGIVLAVPFVLTGRLALSAGLHFSWNFIMGGLLGFPVSGNTVKFTVLRIQQGGSELWTGGAFGPEAGLLGLLGLTIMLGVSCVYIKVTRHELTTAELFTKEYEPAVKSDEQTP